MSKAIITESGFAEITVAPGEARKLLEMLKNRIRRLSHLEKAEPKVFAEISSMARVCFVICGHGVGDSVILSRLSKEDIEAMYVLDHGMETERLLRDLDKVRMTVKRTGPVDLDVSDQAAKSMFEVMNS